MFKVSNIVQYMFCYHLFSLFTLPHLSFMQAHGHYYIFQSYRQAPPTATLPRPERPRLDHLWLYSFNIQRLERHIAALQKMEDHLLSTQVSINLYLYNLFIVWHGL